MGGPQLGEIEAGAFAQLFGVPFAIITEASGLSLAFGWSLPSGPLWLNILGMSQICSPRLPIIVTLRLVYDSTI